ncbi:hypothetical protein D0Y65_031486 [Glycine soja]|uniref:PGG domain-containing protein n=1 Tax=Glycine soja TaxID=3848 RepID=A0A445I8X2_GLYSO|nr:hypothetical protein D0Y65_031486 [Glycine soja]
MRGLLFTTQHTVAGRHQACAEGCCTALWILERYEHLAYEKEDNELTTLQLLAKMPSTFKSQTQMGPLKNFMDVVHHVEDYGQRDRTVSMGRSQQEGKSKEIKGEQEGARKPTYTPLLMAACNGITEIVEVIIHFHPHSIEHVSDDEQNILYMAVKHRQKKIYQILKKLKMRIEKRLPYHYTIHKNKYNKTAKQLFMEKHEALLSDAREWIKETAQSCSAVAVLVATVVFAAAYTVPGGTDDNGFPRFLHETIFLVFTIMDIVALVSSLGSVNMFLSILTSPCEMWDFRKSLPRKLNAGFALLFFSMAATMLSFSATVLINIKLEKNKWTSTLTYAAAFFPVCIFALVQFPLYVAMKGCLRSLLRNLKKIIPRFLLNLVKKSRRKKLWDI